MKEKLRKEEEISRLNRNKIVNHWRSILRNAKTEQLRNELQILSQNHERNLDRKDAIIQMMDCDLEEAEDQYRVALQAHLAAIGLVEEEHKLAVAEAEERFERQAAQIKESYEREIEEAQERHRKELGLLRSEVSVFEEEEERRNENTQQRHDQHREETKNKNLEEINMLRIALDGQIEELEHLFESAHLQYLQQTNQRTRDFKELTKSDQKLSREIDVHRRMVDRLQSQLQHWKVKIQQLEREDGEKRRLLQEEKENIQKHYQQLKRRIQAYRREEDRQVLELTTRSRQFESRMRQQADLMERILRDAEIARKLETEQEQVLPFQDGGSALSPEDRREMLQTLATETNVHPVFQRRGEEEEEERKATASTARSAMFIKEEEEEGEEEEGQFSGDRQYVPASKMLTLFYKKFNRVLLDKMVLEQERERLAQENRHLETVLKQYVDGLTVNDRVLGGDNPLVIVNGRSSVGPRRDGGGQQQPLPVRESTIPVAEANHLVATSRVGSKQPF